MANIADDTSEIRFTKKLYKNLIPITNYLKNEIKDKSENGLRRCGRMVGVLIQFEQPEEELDCEDGKVEGEEEHSLEQEGAQGYEDAGGADVEVDNEIQPAVVILH